MPMTEQLIDLKTFIEKVEAELVPKIPKEIKDSSEDFLIEALTLATVLYSLIDEVEHGRMSDEEYEKRLEKQKNKHEWLGEIQTGTVDTDFATSIAQLARGHLLENKVTGRGWTGNRHKT